MPLKLKFRKERVITDEIFYLFRPLVDLYEWDKSQNKDKANKLLMFVFYLCDLTEENPLKDVPAEKKEEEAKFKAFADRRKEFTKSELKYLIPAIDCYIKYNSTPEERILNKFDEKSEQLRDKLESTKPITKTNSKGGITTFASNTGIITKGLNELNTIKKSKASVVAAVRREAMSQSIRGQQTLSPLSKGNIQLYSINDEQ
jgi:hypothetical protein